jgi:glycosyltransferase involved in cell wall biosynthesis
MRILHVTPYYSPAYAFGGVVRAVEGLAKAQAAQGHQITILTTDALSLEARLVAGEETHNGIRIIRAKNWAYRARRYNLSTPFSISSIAKNLLPQTDIVHLHEFRTVENLLIAPLAAKLNKPLILSPHGTTNTQTGRSSLKLLWDKLLSPRIAPKIAHVVALAEAELDDIQALWTQFGQTKTGFSIVPNGVNLADFANLPNPVAFRQKFDLGDARIILFMGRLHARKGVEVLTRAFLQARLPNTKLLLAGPDEGMRVSLKSLANEDVILTGYLSGEERLAALAAASLFALPAIGEGLSMAVLEAMAAGLPVLLSPGCNFPEAETANAGKIVVSEVESLQAAMQAMFSDANLVQMGQNARQLIRERFTWERVLAQLDTVYHAAQNQTSGS